jgi:hypothetical protein
MKHDPRCASWQVLYLSNADLTFPSIDFSLYSRCLRNNVL